MSVETILEYIPLIPSISELQDNGITWSIAFSMFEDVLLVGLVGWFVAWWLERMNLRALAIREEELKHVDVEASHISVPIATKAVTANILTGSIVLSHDMFRSLTIFITRVFGGNIKHYERLLVRGRREAIVRLKEDAIGKGFKRVVNLKIVTTRVKTKGPSTIEVLAYGTGVFS